MAFRIPAHIIQNLLGAPEILLGSWHGREEMWQVQHHFDRPYFRRVEEIESGKVARIWATMEPCAPSETESHFRISLEHGEFGLWHFGSYCSFSKGKLGGDVHESGPPLALEFICHSTGVGWVRETLSARWLWFDPQATRLLALFPDLWDVEPQKSIPIWRQAVIAQKWEELWFRSLSQTEFDELQGDWQKGNSAELERVVGWLAQVGLLQDRFPPTASINWTRDHNLNFSCGTYTNLVEKHRHEWSQILQRRFQVAGFDLSIGEWRRHRSRRLFSQDPLNRARWDIHGFRVFCRLSQGRPTHHERIEAQLSLAQWLRGEVEEDEIEPLLLP